MSVLAIFLSGMATMGCLWVGLFFFRFWVRTKDHLFLAFGVAFWLLALNQMVLVLSGVPREELSWVYLLRVLGFAVLIVGIVIKNLSTRTR